VLKKENVYSERLCRDKKSRLNCLSNKRQVHVECLNFRKWPAIECNILKLLNWLERAVIFSDSKAAILSAGSTETVTSTETKDCQVLIRQLKAKHKQIVLQWIPGHSQIAWNEYADTLAKKGAKITQKHIRETSYHSIKLHLKQVFRSAYRQELGTKLFQKPWTQELAKIPERPRRNVVAEFRLCVGRDCLGIYLHRVGIRPDPYCMLCSLHETMDRNYLGQSTVLSSGTECERYWEARTKVMENWLLPFSITISMTTPHY